MSETRCCKKCKRDLPLSEFRIQSGRKSPRTACRECDRQANRVWHEANPERNAARTAKWRDTNPGADAEVRRRRRDRHGARVRAQEAASKRRQHARDPEGFCAKLAERRRAWSARNPDRAAALARNVGARRRARKIGGRGPTPEEWCAILDQFGHRCAYCGVGSCNVKLTKDHATPLCRGGLHDPSNIVPACARCNSRKRHRTADEFREYLAQSWGIKAA